MGKTAGGWSPFASSCRITKSKAALIGAGATASIAAMPNWITRWLSTLLLGALVAFGISNWAVASRSMMPAMAQLGVVSEAMPSMDCHDGSAAGACSSGMASCAVGCASPGLDLPLPVRMDERIAVIRAAAAAIADPADGLRLPPGLPPPRSLGVT